MDKFSCLNDSRTEDEVDDDDDSFITAREYFAVNRSSFLTDDDTFVTVRANFSSAEDDLSISSNLDETLVMNLPHEQKENNALAYREHSENYPENDTVLEGRMKSTRKETSSSIKPKPSKLKIPKCYFLEPPKLFNKAANPIKDSDSLRRIVRKPLKNFALSNRIRPPTQFKKFIGMVKTTQSSNFSIT